MKYDSFSELLGTTTIIIVDTINLLPQQRIADLFLHLLLLITAMVRIVTIPTIIKEATQISNDLHNHLLEAIMTCINYEFDFKLAQF